MFVIPNKNKIFKIDNSSMSLGNIYSTFNIMFDADQGRIKLNPYITKLYNEDNNVLFVNPFAAVVGAADSSTYGSFLDCYILTTGYLWSMAGSVNRITGANSASAATDATSDVCLFLGWGTSPTRNIEKLYVSDSAGLHHVNPANSLDAWDTLNETADTYKNNFILLPFLEQNRLYMFKSTGVTSTSETADTVYSAPPTSGSYCLTGLSNITCARASSKRIWFASSSGGLNSNRSKVYEWDGVQPNPLNIHVLDTDTIQAMTILNDIPYVIDGRGRLWAYDGYTFKVIDNIPVREDDTGSLTCVVHRNGMVTDKGKIYILVGSYGDGINTHNTTERALAGIWCFDPKIGLYHFDSPQNSSVIFTPLVLSRYTNQNSFIAGYVGASSKNTVSVSDTVKGLSGTNRIGYIITQFMESKNLSDMFNTIGLKYRDMIDPSAQIEVKYRTKKNIECNATITWTSTTTFTCSTATLAGTGTYYNTQVAVGDEVMIQQGAGVGTIAHVTVLADVAGTTTVTIDRSSGVSTGTGYAMFTNYTLLRTITQVSGKTFENIRLGKAQTMVQIKLVLSWKGYYDEIQEIQLSEQAQEKLT